MPPRTRSQTHELDGEGSTMYPASVTSPVPMEVGIPTNSGSLFNILKLNYSFLWTLNALIDEAMEGTLSPIYGGGPPHGSLCILTTEDLDSFKHGSRNPMKPFRSPFLGMTDNEVRSWMCEHRHPDFAYDTFAVLDGDTVENRTCRIGYSNINAEEGGRMLTTDFYASTFIRIPLELAETSWCEEVWEEELRAGNGGVYNRKCIEQMEHED